MIDKIKAEIERFTPPENVYDAREINAFQKCLGWAEELENNLKEKAKCPEVNECEDFEEAYEMLANHMNNFIDKEITKQFHGGKVAQH